MATLMLTALGDTWRREMGGDCRCRVIEDYGGWCAVGHTG
jgi:hypothetical protein